MRLNLTLSPSTESVPFTHLHRLTGTLHKWAGPDNALHDGLSLYSFGWLHGATAQDGALHFPEGSRWRLSFYDPDAAKDVMEEWRRSETIRDEVTLDAFVIMPNHMHGIVRMASDPPTPGDSRDEPVDPNEASHGRAYVFSGGVGAPCPGTSLLGGTRRPNGLAGHTSPPHSRSAQTPSRHAACDCLR